MKKAIFLDRDGVINIAPPRGKYIISKEEIVINEGIVEFICKSIEKGFLIFIVTNQPQVAKGLLSLADLHAINGLIVSYIMKHGGRIDRLYYCPHKDEDGCRCRKPKSGMLLQAVKEFDVNIHNSYLVGDSWKDIEAGRAAGCITIFMKTEIGKEELERCTPDYVVSSFNEITEIIK